MVCTSHIGALRSTRAGRGDAGFTLIEVIVACLVLVMGILALSQFLTSAIATVSDSETRSLLHQVAAQELETVRSMEYDQVGTVGGHPAGPLLSSETRTVEGVDLIIVREVTYVADVSYSGPYPANYRRVTIGVRVAGNDRLAPVELASLVAGGAPGGALDVTVTDSQGNPVPDVLIKVDNDHLSPQIHISSSAIRTDSLGHLLIPGLPPDATTSYYVEASKSGYNLAWTDPMVVVNEGLPYTVVQFVIDRVSTLNVHVVDEEGSPSPAWRYRSRGRGPSARASRPTATATNRWWTSGFSTSANPYVFAVTPGQGYQPVSVSVTLEPGVTQDVTIEVARIPTTTTTTAGGPGTDDNHPVPHHQHERARLRLGHRTRAR